MGYPELDHDESIILETRTVKYKSILFDAILTNKRIILTGGKKNIIPAQNIALSTIRNVEAGENAIRDHFLILSLTTETGEKQQTVLTFLRSAGGERKRECNEWAKKLKSLILPSSPDKTATAFPVPDSLPSKREGVESTQTAATSTRPAKKKIEIVRPLGTIIEKSPVAPVPIESSSLPSGTFCSRCGNRVPFKSPFCNHCGTPIINVPSQAYSQPPDVSRDQVPVPPITPQPLIPKTPVTDTLVPPKPIVPKEQVPVPQTIPQPLIPKTPVADTPVPSKPMVPKVEVPVPHTVDSAGESPSRPVDQIIHSIEPLIEDSVPRTHPAPLYKKPVPEQPSKPVISEVQEESIPEVLWPVLPNAESPAVLTQVPIPAEPESPPPPPAPEPAGKKTNYLAIGILIIAILPIIAGLVIVANIMAVPSGGPETLNATTTVVTTIPTPTPQLTRTPAATATISPASTQLMIPPTGVWVRASYPGTYIGLIGTAGNQIEVTGTGDKFYSISTTDGIVAAALQKKDGSGDKIILEVYKNGVMVKRESTTTPKGIVEIQLDLKTLPVSDNSTP
ncbi:MAG: hypothetical protein M0Q91_03830 [Methanoregula sp.]|jgi:hypothetical protein|nr:hypothetical protein [Methanoregula sp.]